jgi:hypothetical protein
MVEERAGPVEVEPLKAVEGVAPAGGAVEWVAAV